MWKIRDVRTEKEPTNLSATSQESPALGIQAITLSLCLRQQSIWLNSANFCWVLATHTYSIPLTLPSQFTSKNRLKIICVILGVNIVYAHTHTHTQNIVHGVRFHISAIKMWHSILLCVHLFSSKWRYMLWITLNFTGSFFNQEERYIVTGCSFYFRFVCAVVC